MILYIIVILLSVLVDQLSKVAVDHWLPSVGDSFPLIENVLHFTRVNNTGAAFGSMQNARWFFMVVSSLAIVLMVVALFKWKSLGRLGGVAIALAAGGGIGNMIDRIFRGYVVDFIDFCAFPSLWKWVFNVADACVCVGCALLFIYILFVEMPAEKKAAAKKSEGEND